jgi:hypothetical protein
MGTFPLLFAFWFGRRAVPSERCTLNFDGTRKRGVFDSFFGENIRFKDFL